MEFMSNHTNISVNREKLLDIAHEMIIEQLIDLDKVCRKYNIKYSLDSGTLLGAVREKKIISWDDDADIVMTRIEFEKFDKYYLSNKSRELKYDYDGQWLKRISHKNPPQVSGISLSKVCTDIFILDNSSDNKLKEKIKIFILKALQGLMKRKPNYSSFGFVHKILSFVLSFIGKFLPYKCMLCLYNKVSTIDRYNITTKYAIYNYSFKNMNIKFSKNLNSSFTNILLENHEFLAFMNSDYFLKKLYGDDYMNLPPVSERVPTHLDLPNQD